MHAMPGLAASPFQSVEALSQKQKAAPRNCLPPTVGFDWIGAHRTELRDDRRPDPVRRRRRAHHPG